jgi:hypothetical protein
MSGSIDQNRIQPVDPDLTSGAIGRLFAEIRTKFALVPNLFRVLANAPAALEGLIGLSAALARGALDEKTREQLADNGSGQIWSESKRVGSINYWSDVVLAKELIPKIRFWEELLILLGLKSAALPNVSCKYEMSYLDIENKAEPRTTGLRYH